MKITEFNSQYNILFNESLKKNRFDYGTFRVKFKFIIKSQ